LISLHFAIYFIHKFLSFLLCTGVLIEGITVSAPADAPETDCIDPDSSQDVIIRNVDLQGGDDCIAIKSGMDNAGLAVNISSANILIENSRMGPCGAISFGSESSGGIHNVTVRNIVMQATDAGFYIKSGRGRGGVVQNLHLENVQVQSALIGVLVSMYYTSLPPSTNLTTTPQLHNVTWTNVTGNTVLAAGQFCCLSEMPCTHLDLQQVKFTSLLSAYTNCEYAFGSADSATSPSPMNCLQPGEQESSDLTHQWQLHLRSRDRGHVANNNPLCHAHMH
jgi:polygalacturonase